MAQALARPSGEQFLLLASGLLGRAPGLTMTVAKRRFRALFGVSPVVCAAAWSIAGPQLPRGARPKHLLWALMFLKIYGTEHTHAAIAHVDEKTFRKWSWAILELISNLSVASLVMPWPFRMSLLGAFAHA